MRRAVALVVWLLTVSMTVAWVWVIALGDFMEAMLSAAPGGGRLSLPQGWGMVAYAAMVGVAIVTIANSTVGLLLATRQGGGRMGTILLAGGVAFAAVPFGYAVGGSLALANPLDPVGNALFLLRPASYALAYSLILPILALTFPDGRVPSEGWRWPSGLAMGALATAAILVVIKPGGIVDSASVNPFGVDMFPAWLVGVARGLDG